MMALALDMESLLVDVDATMTLGDLEAELADRELTLGLGADADPHLSVGEWIARGAPGSFDPWLDPADHLLAGLEMLLPGGAHLSIRPAPRRAVGPDFMALGFGTNGRFGTITRAVLRVLHKAHPRRRTEAFDHPRNPPLEPGEATLLGAIEAELSSVRGPR